MESIIIGIVYRRNDIDNNAIVSVITEEGILDFFCNGVNKINSKNNVSLQLGNIVTLEYFKSNKGMHKLKKAKIETQFNILNTHISKSLFKGFSYITADLKLSRTLFNLTRIFIDNLSKSYVYSLTWFINSLLSEYGYQQILDRCVNCGSKKLIAEVNLDQGGILCKKHSKRVMDSSLIKDFFLLNDDIEHYIKNVNDNNDRLLNNMISSFLKDKLQF